MFLPKTFTGGGYQVTVNADRSILVKQGDWLSKYSMAIYGDFVDPHIRKFKRREKLPDGRYVFKDVIPANLIRTGETLYHPDRLPGEQDTAPKDPKNCTGKICRRAALLTCVTNAGGMGPGHSAVVVDDQVFTFEIAAGGRPASSTSDWLKYKSEKYLEINTWRPVVVMELKPAMVNATAVHDFIMQSDTDGATYGGNGRLCSHLAAEAIGAGLGRDIDPTGLNTPIAVATFVKNTGAVSSSYFTFKDAGDGSNLTPAQTFAMLHLARAFPDEFHRRREPPGILKWT